MQPAVFRALEFDRIREALAREAATPLGRTRALGLEPATDAVVVQAALDLTTAAASYVAQGGALAIDAPDGLPDILAALDVGDEPLAPVDLVGLARFVSSVERVGAAVGARGGPLGAIGARVPSFSAETAAIDRAIEPGGEVRDTASPALRDIREALRRSRARLRAALEDLTRSRDHAKYLQDQIITDRNGRYVVVVRAEHREGLPGIVHGASTSGASLYVEPLHTVELNNDIVSLAEREKAEIHRVLLALTNAFRDRDGDVEALVDGAADLDELYAKARLAARVDGRAPALVADGRIAFRGARHPLLIPALRDRLADGAAGGEAGGPPGARGPSVVVPADLTLVPPARALVISGPNTGGKTVALKAFGLLVLMSQAGLLIPVDAGSELTPFRSVFAAIGDEQSIAASLSTFSANIAALVEIERALELPALVLLDEVGSGTDPVEGGALGAAVIDHFRLRGAVVVATTHDDALKSYAATTGGVVAAAFGFDPDSFAPSYRLLYGAPGRSLAIEIAERLGMPARVVADARARRSGRESLLASHLARVDQEIAAVEREKRHALEIRAALERERQAVRDRETRLSEREAHVKRRIDERVGDKLREARAEVDEVVSRLRQKAESLAGEIASRAAQPARTKPALSTGDLGALRQEAQLALGAIERHVGSSGAPAAEARLTAPPEPGQPVLVSSLGTTGVVRQVSGRFIEVDVRGKRLRVPVGDLRHPAPGGGAPGDDLATPPARRVTGPLAPRAAGELVVIGQTVDDALAHLEKYLDGAMLSEERRFRVVHGHGTGKLREAVRSFLRAHPLVATAAAAPDREGGQGATVVELKD
jgi:DNA mismatch repair protein MutS2